MQISMDAKMLLIKRQYDLDITSNIITIAKSDTLSAGYLLRKTIKKGASLIVFGKNMDYYRYVHDIAPNNLGQFEYKDLISEFKVPFIDNSSKKAAETVTDIFDDFRMNNVFKHMQKRGKRTLKDPCLFQSFFIIQNKGIIKEKVVLEALLGNILSQAAHCEPMHELVIFVDMPYAPITSTCLDTLKMADKRHNITFISQISDKAVKSYDLTGKNIFIYSDSGKIFIKAPNKELEVIDDEISKLV